MCYKNEHCMSPWGISYYDELSWKHRNNHGGSSLSDALELCYGPNAVIHKLSGKSVARALRGYILVEAALSQILLQNLLSEIHLLENNTGGTHNRLTYKNEHGMSPWGISYYELSGKHRNNHGGSSLSDALELCYGPNAQIHKLSGKSVARALLHSG